MVFLFRRASFKFLAQEPNSGFSPTGFIWPKRASRACRTAFRGFFLQMEVPKGQKDLLVPELCFALFFESGHAFSLIFGRK